LQICHGAIIQICIDGYIIAVPIIHNNKSDARSRAIETPARPAAALERVLRKR
jgi:hypothetical protein